MPGKLAEFLGVQVIEDSEDRMELRTPVTEIMLQPHGVLHGGISAFLAEEAASECTTHHTNIEEVHALGLQIDSSHFLPIMAGDTIQTVATPVSKGGRIRVWKIEQFRMSDGKMFNSSQLTMYLQKVHHYGELIIREGLPSGESLSPLWGLPNSVAHFGVFALYFLRCNDEDSAAFCSFSREGS